VKKVTKGKRYTRLSKIASETNFPFPKHKLQNGNGNGNRVVLVACGSFSPITFMHLRLFEQVRDFGSASGFNIVGGYFSPVTDAYKKKGLASATDRVKMCELATQSSDWLMVDDWESKQSEYFTTLPVLEHFSNCLNKDLKKDEQPYKVMLTCGSDLLQSINTPGVWAKEDVEDILTKHGIFVLERIGTNSHSSIYENDLLFKYQKNIHVVPQWIPNDISSTKVRQSVLRGTSIKYLTPDPVVDYIHQHKLYSNL